MWDIFQNFVAFSEYLNFITSKNLPFLFFQLTFLESRVVQSILHFTILYLGKLANFWNSKFPIYIQRQINSRVGCNGARRVYISYIRIQYENNQPWLSYLHSKCLAGNGRVKMCGKLANNHLQIHTITFVPTPVFSTVGLNVELVFLLNSHLRIW